MASPERKPDIGCRRRAKVGHERLTTWYFLSPSSERVGNWWIGRAIGLEQGQRSGGLVPKCMISIGKGIHRLDGTPPLAVAGIKTSRYDHPCWVRSACLLQQLADCALAILVGLQRAVRDDERDIRIGI